MLADPDVRHLSPLINRVYEGIGRIAEIVNPSQ